MSNLQKLILGRWQVSSRDTNSKKEEFLLEEIPELFACKNLEELRMPSRFLLGRFFSGRSLLFSAIESGNKKLVESILSQLELFFFHGGGKACKSSLETEINLEDDQGLTPLQLALQKKDQAMALLLLQKGGRGKRYHLEDLQKRGDFSCEAGNPSECGAHLRIGLLPKEKWSTFFTALAEDRRILSVEITADFVAAIEERQSDRVFFFQGLSEALQQNPQILLLDLRSFTGLSAQEVQPILACPAVEELLLSPSLRNFVDNAGRNFLHFAVLACNKKSLLSFLAQGVPLSQKDDKGYTPARLARELAAHSAMQEIAACLEAASREKLAQIVFGQREWEKYYGKIGKEPPLPVHILELVESPCPIWQQKRVHETHFLVLIPQKLDGSPFNVVLLGERIRNSNKGGYATKYMVGFEDKTPYVRSQWVLFTKDVLPHTKSSTREECLQEINALAARAPSIPGLGEYRVPKRLEGLTCILTEYVRSGRRFYRSEDKTYTHCQEKEVYGDDLIPESMGGFCPSGIYPLNSAAGLDLTGQGVLREVRG